MKDYRFRRLLIGFISLFMVACNASQDNSFDETVLKGLPHFEYMGYTYYIHPHLAVYSMNLTNGGYGYAFNAWENAVSTLDSYGHQKWFIPTISELLEAAQQGLLQKEFGYHSSDGHHLFYWEVSNSWESTFVVDKYIEFTVVPMIKLRTQ